MKPAPFAYERPETIEEALAVLAVHGDEAKVLAGGQSLVPMLNMRLLRPSVVVDVNRVPGLDGLRADNGEIRVGALVRQAAFGGSRLVRERLPLAASCVPYVGHFVTRNRGTVGGSIAHADVSAELPLALLVQGGSAVVASTRGRREIPAEELFLTHFTTALAPDELLVETVWPASEPETRTAWVELAQRRGDYALAMVACTLRVEGGLVAEARIGLGSVVDRPSLVPEAAEALVRRGVDAAPEAAVLAARSVEPYDNLHASARYQRHLVRVLVERAVRQAWA